MRKRISAVAMFAAAVSFAGTANAGMDEAKKWVEKEFQPSTLSKEEQLKEMNDRYMDHYKEDDHLVMKGDADDFNGIAL